MSDGSAPARAASSTAIVAAMLLLWTALAAVSWWSSDLPANDFERFVDPVRTALCLALLLGLVLAYVRLVEDSGPLPARTVWLGFAALAVPAALCFPIGSKDVFLYAMYGAAWHGHGANPHLVSPATLVADPWYPLLATWPEAPASFYGPLFSMQMWAIHALAGGSLAAAVAIQKGIGLAAVAAAGTLLARLRAHAGAAPPGGRLALWLWSPLILFDGVATPHNDTVMIALVLGALLLWLRGSPGTAAGLLMLAFWYKWYAVVLLPMWLAWSWRRWSGRGWTTQAVAAVAVSVIALLPFAYDLPRMITRALQADGVREIVPHELPPPLWLLWQALELTGATAAPLGVTLFHGARIMALVGGIAWIVWRRRGVAYAPELVLRDALASVALFFAVVPAMLWPWHLVSVCALLLALPHRRAEWATLAITAVALVSYFLTFVWALVAGALAAAALRLLRDRKAAALRSAAPRHGASP